MSTGNAHTSERRVEKPLSRSQSRLWFLESLGQLGPTYNVSVCLRLDGPLDPGALARAATALSARHESLRTHIASVKGSAFQVIAPPGPVVIEIETLERLGRGNAERLTREWAQREADAPFDLERGPLFRVSVLRVEAQVHVVVLCLHHIICDAWSTSIVRRELFAIYEAEVAGTSPALEDEPLQYGDFAVWEDQWLRRNALSEQHEYWREQLSGMSEALPLPTDRSRPRRPSYRGGQVELHVDGAVMAPIVKAGMALGATPFMVILAAFQALLSRLCSVEDVVTATPVAGRVHPRTMGTVGFFLNTLLLRTDLSGDPAFSELVKRVRDVTLRAFAHQDVPFDAVVAELHPRRDLQSQPLFQVMFSWVPASQTIRCATGLEVRDDSELVKRTTAKFDLMLFALEPPAEQGFSAGMTFIVEYSTDLFDHGTVERVAGYFSTLLTSLGGDVSQRLSRLSLLTQVERSRLLGRIESQTAGRPDSRGTCVHDRFAAQRRRTPGAVALICGEEQVTYQMLDEHSNRIARYLLACGAGQGAVVGMCIDQHSPLLIPVFLAVLKAGAVCLPLDPSYPQERLEYMLENARASVLIHSEDCATLVPASFKGERVSMEQVAPQIARCSADALTVSVLRRDLAYILYTSGSTGKPKGAALPHAALACVVEFQCPQVAGERTLQLAPLNFDVSFQEIFVTLCRGATLVQGSREMRRDVRLLMERLVRDRINELYVPQVLLQAIAEHARRTDVSALVLDNIYQAGEPLRLTPQVTEFLARLPGVHLHNHYGPTETYVMAMYPVPDDVLRQALRSGGQPSVPVGHAIPTTSMYVLDSALEPVPAGVVGELYIGGDSLAHGYVYQPTVTAERFIADPFGEPGSRMYRTGDLGRYCVDGSVECLGRMDSQVKIRGFRIETGEVEACLLTHPAVRQAAVLIRKRDVTDARLEAYLEFAEPATAEEIREHLSRTLPEYMIPSLFISVETFPRTASGKLDVQALLASGADRVLRREYESPRTPLEDVVAGIWRDVLRVDRVGRNDNFFELGGHSLLALKLLAAIDSALNRSLPLHSVFESPTVAQLSSRWLHGAGSASRRHDEENLQEGVI